MEEAGNDDGQGTQDYVTRDEIQDQARELTRRQEVRIFILAWPIHDSQQIEPTLDPHDVSWIDKETGDDDIDMNVKVANTARRKNIAIRRGGFDKDFDDAPEVSA